MPDRSEDTPLEGRVVVVNDPAAARAAADAGASVVIVSPPDGDDPTEAAIAATVTELDGQGNRVARFVGTLEDADDRRALAEMLTEIFTTDDP